MNHYPTVTSVAFKGDVRLMDACLDPCMTELLRVAMRTAPPLWEDTLVVTSANDSKHSGHSFHYVGRAYDIRYLGPQRTGGIMVPADYTEQQVADKQRLEARMWAGRMRQQLPEGYDVVVEGNHIHAERDSCKRGG